MVRLDAPVEGGRIDSRESEVWRKKPGPGDPGADVESLPAGRTGSYLGGRIQRVFKSDILRRRLDWQP
jgi:hypothetical protein